MRLIDADELERKLMRSDVVHKYVSEDALYIVLGAIDIAPSIDIVRCKECKKRKKNGFCRVHMRIERNDGFCSYGERRDE